MTELVLASASQSRQRLLRAAGVSFAVQPAPVDETEMKEALRAEGATPAHIAEVLAELKAVRVSQKRPEDLVLGGDQTLALGGETLDKPANMEEAAEQLRRMAGGIHELPTAVVIAENGAPVWRFIARPRVRFRQYSEAFIQNYLARAGESVLHTVGACEIEGLGGQLIARVQGDYFAVLGLPLLEVLDYLRTRGILET